MTRNPRWITQTAESGSVPDRRRSLGGGLLGLGGLTGYVSANKLAAEQTDPDTGASRPGDPQTYQIVGLAMAGVGAVILGLGVVDAIRLRDTEEDAGRVTGAKTTNDLPCRPGPVASRAVRLTLGEGTEIRGTTDRRGAVVLSLLDAPSAAFAPGTAFATLRAADGGFTLAIELADDDRSRLIAALTINPKSRAGAELLAAQRASCRALVQAASSETTRAGDASELERAVSSLKSAKIACGQHWSSEDERAATAAGARLPELKKKEAAQRCERALGEIRSGLEETALEELLARVQETAGADCAEVPGAADKLKKLGEQARARDKARQRAGQLASTLHELAAEIGNAKIERVRSALHSDPELRGLAQKDEGVVTATLNAIKDAVGEVIRAGRSGPAATRMCQARKLFIQVRGVAPWKQLRKELAEKHSAEDPLAISKFLQALEAGACK